MGCEGMWLNHFKVRYRRTKRFQLYRERYYQYLPEDCCDLCRTHHREIHRHYYLIIGRWVRKYGTPKKWTWHRANELMTELRGFCRTWCATPEGVSQ